MNSKQIPAKACHFEGQFEFRSNGEGAKSVPFKMMARTAQPIEHWFWGKAVHDMDGLNMHKAKLPIDYAHDSNTILGYANKFNTDENGLTVHGALTPTSATDKAQEVIDKANAGVPYEASISFGGDGIVIEQVPEGSTAYVNGYDLDGPATIFRQWPLRGIAVCPYGADRNTSTQFKDENKEIKVNFMETTEMKNEEKKVEPEGVETELEAEADAVEAGVESEPDTEAEAVDVEGVDDEPTAEQLDDRSELKFFMETFGDEQGAKFYADGFSFTDALVLYVGQLRKQNEELCKKLESMEMGESPVSEAEAEKVTPVKDGLSDNQRLFREALKKKLNKEQ